MFTAIVIAFFLVVGFEAFQCLRLLRTLIISRSRIARTNELLAIEKKMLSAEWTAGEHLHDNTYEMLFGSTLIDIPPYVSYDNRPISHDARAAFLKDCEALAQRDDDSREIIQRLMASVVIESLSRSYITLCGALIPAVIWFGITETAREGFQSCVKLCVSVIDRYGIKQSDRKIADSPAVNLLLSQTV